MGGQNGIQTSVNAVPAVGVAGDFASANVYYSVLAGPGGLVAGPNGVTVGVFAWAVAPDDADGAPATVNSFGSGPVTGFCHREQQALITAFLGFASMLVPEGYPITLMSGGDFWVVNAGTTEAVPGNKAYANFANGSVSFAATGQATAGASATGSSIAAETASYTGSITGNVMTVSALISGNVYPGETISGTNVASGTVVGQQLTPLLPGEALNGIGRYYVSVPEQTVASTTISATYGELTVGTVTAGNFAVGQVLEATGSVVAGTAITAALSGTGGSGSTFVVTNNTVVSSQTISAYGNVETKWAAMSAGAPGELVKISSHVLG